VTQASVDAPVEQITDERVSALGSRGRLAGWVGLPAALVALMTVGTVVSPKFLTVGNLLNVLTAMSIVGIIVVGMTFVIIVQGLADLSVPATVAIGAIVVLSTQDTLGSVGSIVVALLAAGAAGLVNGLLIGYGKANPIIVTLGIGIIVLGLVQAIVGGGIVYGTASGTPRFLTSRILGIPALVIVFLVIAVIGHLLLSRTVWGRWTYAVGSNYAATEASAVPVRRTRAAAFVLTAFLSGVSGVLLGLTLLSARPVVGTGYEFDAITAVVVGGVSLLGGFGSIPRALAGLLLVQVLTNILVLTGVPTPVQGLAKGSIIAAAVGVDVYLRRKGGR
jgi:ribose/xylose/arabinose/galactoside ABC-type transport system permease subunit